MLNIKSKKLCSVKCKVLGVKGITPNRIYKVIRCDYRLICIYNDYGLSYWYNREYFEEVKSND